MSQNTRSKTAAQKTASNPSPVTPTPQAPSSSGTKQTRPANPRTTTKAEQQEAHIDARTHLASKGLLKHAAACTSTSVVKALLMFTTVHKLDDEAAKTLHCISTVVETLDSHCAGCTRTDFLTEMLELHQAGIQNGLEDKLEEIRRTIQEKLPSLTAASDSLGAFEETAKSLNQAATRLEGMITKAADSTTELANTARSYKEVLLSNPVNVR